MDRNVSQATAQIGKTYLTTQRASFLLSACRIPKLFSIPSFFFFPVSPCRRFFGGEEKLQPVVQYKPQRSYNRSAIEITRMFLNITVGTVNTHVEIYVVLLKAVHNKIECVLSAVANLGVSNELQAKLQDVMVMRTLLSIGKILGEGE